MDMSVTPREIFTSRILYDVPCGVCQDNSSGKHYGIFACDGCAGFFKRSVRYSREYECKGPNQGQCNIDKRHRNQCRACRLQKCLEAGMNRDTVQHERGPRNSTIQRNLAALMGDAAALSMPNFANVPLNAGQSTPLGIGHVYQPFLSTIHVPMSPFHPAYYSSTTPILDVLASRGLQPTMYSYIKQVTAELISKNVSWVKSVRSFIELPYSDQLQLVEDSWKELFLLGMAQYIMPINFNQLLLVYEVENGNRPDVMAIVYREIHAMQDVLNKLFNLCIDRHEYDYLRAMALFRKPVTFSKEDCGNSSSSTESSRNSSTSNSPNNVYCITDPNKVGKLKEESYNGLLAYIGRTYPHQPLRLQTIMSIMISAGEVSAMAIEEVFFRKDIGNDSIVRVITNLYESR